jgi:hypothetical protein
VSQLPLSLRSTYVSPDFVENLFYNAIGQGYLSKVEFDSSWKVGYYSYTIYQTTFLAPSLSKAFPNPLDRTSVTCSLVKDALLSKSQFRRRAEDDTFLAKLKFNCDLLHAEDKAKLFSFETEAMFLIRIEEGAEAINVTVVDSELGKVTFDPASPYKVED